MSPRKRPNGVYQWRANVPGRGDVARSLRTKSRAIARRREAAIAALLERGRLDLVLPWIDGALSLLELVEAYESNRVDELMAKVRASSAPELAVAVEAALAWKKPDVRPRTLERYTDGLTHLREFHGDDVRVDEALTAEAVQAFKAARLDVVKPGTVNKDLQAVSILATFAHERGWITSRPTVKKLRVDWQTWAIDSAERAAYMVQLRPAFRPIMAFLLGTGCRLGEAERLRVQDLTLGDRPTASIRYSKTSAGVRPVPLARSLADTLRARIEDEGLVGSDLVFEAIPRRTLQKEHRRATKAAGLPPQYTIHRHRDTFAVMVARRGMPLTTLQKILGHRTIAQTMKYASYAPGYDDAAPFLDDAPTRPAPVKERAVR